MQNCLTPIILFLSFSTCQPAFLQQCYTSGLNCVKFEKAYFEFVDDVKLTANNIPTLKENTNTSTRIVLSELLSQLAFNHSWTLAALVLNAGNRQSVQWKISPDANSEHPIEIQEPNDDNGADNSTIHTIDVTNYGTTPQRVLVVPPNYEFFFSSNGSTDSCYDSGLSVIPFMWDTTSRSRISGMSYFQLSQCSASCISLPIPAMMLKFCPNSDSSDISVNIHKNDDYMVELSDDLLGLNVKRLNNLVDFPIGIIDCQNVFEDSSVFGDKAICLGDGDNVAVKFGTNPRIALTQEVKTRYSPRSAFLKNAKNPVYPNFTISHAAEVAKCTDTASFEVKQVSGNGFMPLKFEWIVLNGTEEMANLARTTSERLFNVPRELLSDVNVLLVTGCNVAGKCTASEPLVTEMVDDASVFSVAIDGYEQETPNSFSLKLHANPTFQECSSKSFPKDVQYEWQLNGEGQLYDDGVKLPAFKYNVNEVVNITVIAKYSKEKTYSSSVTKTIHYVGLPLLVTLDCIQKQVAKDKDLLIRALATDQNRRESTLEYKWQCSIITGNTTSKPCEFSETKQTDSTLKISAAKLVEDTMMNISVTVTSDNQTDSASCLVTVGAPKLPVISFFRMIEKKQNVNDYIRIQALVGLSTPNINITWEVVRDTSFGFFNISSFLRNSTIIVDNVPSNSDVVVSLTIPPASNSNIFWPGLMSGRTYAIRLWATNEKGSSFAELKLLTNAPPTVGKIDITSAHIPIIALQTPVTFSIGDGWNDDKDDFPLSYQFGYKTYFGNNETEENWFSRSTMKAHQFYFPSTNNNVSESCPERSGYSAILSVCDRLGSCSSKESEMFVVEQPLNTSTAAMDLVCLMNVDVTNGNFISAVSKIYALNLELCTSNFDSPMTDKIILLMLQSLTMSSESIEFQEALRSIKSLLPVVSSEILTELIEVLSNYRTMNTQTVSNRKKRSASTEEQATTSISKGYQATESEANDMLKVYDILIAKDKPVVDVFFLNINDFLTGFCMQLDENSEKFMIGTGNGYTTIQTHSINPNLEGYTGKYNISGDSVANITFLPYFTSSYSLWNCGVSSTTTCRFVCHATAWISQSAMADNSYLNDYLFLNQIYLTVNKSVSDLHQINLVDPISGTVISPSNGQSLYSVDIKVGNYKPINYYECFIFNQNSGWNGRQCVSNPYATTVSGDNYIKCNCSSTGIIGVFIVNPPTPTQLPPHNEILLTMVLDVVVSSEDLVKIFAKISQLSEVDPKRFVKISNSGNKTITAVLRPPTRPDQKTNSVAVQNIQKAVGYQKILNVITVLNFSYSVIKRDLQGDSAARKITVNLYKSYLSQLGSDSDDFAKKWAQTVTNTLQISEYRIKNAKIFFGVVYNFTITLPFTDEPSPLSAEEISIMIQECSKYNEIDLSIQDETVQMNAIQEGDIVKLMVMRETNALMLALIIVLSVILGSGFLFIGGAVVVKMRTDRLIVEERRRAILNEQHSVHAPPEYGNQNMTSPYNISNNYPFRRTRMEVQHY